MGIRDAAPTIVWGPLMSATTMKYLESGKLRDQVHNRSPLWKFLRAKQRLKILTGGERIKLPMMHQGSGNFKRYAGGEVLTPIGYEGITNAFFDWKQAATTVLINGLERRSNQGENRIRELLKDKIMQAEATLGDNLASDAYSDGTSNGSKQLTGLAAMIATTNTSGTYADINFGNNDKWRNQLAASVGNPAANLHSNVRTLYNDCIKIAGVEGQPDAILTTQTLAETLEALVVPAIRYTSGDQDADLGAYPKYKGASIMWDPKCDAGIGFVLNSNHIFSFAHRDANFSMPEAGLQNPVNQDAFIAPILFQGNMATNVRAALGKWTGAS